MESNFGLLGQFQDGSHISPSTPQMGPNPTFTPCNSETFQNGPQGGPQFSELRETDQGEISGKSQNFSAGTRQGLKISQTEFFQKWNNGASDREKLWMFDDIWCLIDVQEYK